MTLLVTPQVRPGRHFDDATAGINAIQWPDVAFVRPSPVRGRVARLLFNRMVHDLPLQVLLPGGRTLGAGTATDPILRLRQPDAFYRRVGASGLIGFGESYMAGEWDADDLTAVLTVFAKRLSVLIPPALQRLRHAATLRQPASDRPARANSQRNVARHYDLSNELFATFLDPTMSYSAAIFAEDAHGRPIAGETLLVAAQHRKIDRLLDRTGVCQGSKVLEIGTGWGELALRAAARGARVTSITLSEQQRELALRRIDAAGLSDLVRVELCDYRDVQGTYDAVISVEMIEAVGYDYWPGFFELVDARVRPGGRVGLQAITMPHERMLASRDTFTWIQKYIFPGGLLPSVAAIQQIIADCTSLRICDRFAFGSHYSSTLKLWRTAWGRNEEYVSQLGFDEVFRRMWSLYLAYSEAGFRSGYLDVQQIILEKAEQS